MKQYYCPYCSNQYELPKEISNELKVCPQCGEHLTKVSFIRPIQPLALIAALAFIIPLLLTFLTLIEEFPRDKNDKGLSEISLIQQT